MNLAYVWYMYEDIDWVEHFTQYTIPACLSYLGGKVVDLEFLC